MNDSSSTERMRRYRARKAREGKRAVYALIEEHLYKRLQRYAAKTKLSLSEACARLLAKGMKRD